MVDQIGNRRASSLRRDDVVAWLNNLAEKNVGSRLREVAYRLTKAAVTPYVTHVEPLDHLSIGRGPRSAMPEVKAWSKEEALCFLAAAVEDRYHAVYVLALVGGLRQGEILALRWRDVREDRITVRGTLNRKSRKVVEPKTAASRRTVAIPAFAVEALAAHRARQKTKNHGNGPDDFVFTAKSGRAVGVKNLYHHSFVPLMQRADVPRISFHALRHTMASLASAAGVNMRVLQEQLGHKDVGTLLSRYAHLVPGAQREAAGKLGAILGQAVVGEQVGESGAKSDVLEATPGAQMPRRKSPAPSPDTVEKPSNHKKKATSQRLSRLERVAGIEPATLAWKASFFLQKRS